MQNSRTIVNSNQMILLGIIGIMLIILFASTMPLFNLPRIYADATGSTVGIAVDQNAVSLSNDALKAIQEAAAQLVATATPQMSPDEALEALRRNAGLTDAAQAEANYVPVQPVSVAQEPIQQAVYVEPVQIPAAPQNPIYTGQPEQPFFMDGTPYHMTPIGPMPCSEIYVEYGGYRAVTQYGSRFESWFNNLQSQTTLAYVGLCDYAFKRGGA